MALSGEEIRRAQRRLLKMGTVISEVFDYSEIPYVIAFGTLLGAVRHGGFVPWDDDFDMFLFDEHYEEGVELLRERLPDWMFVEDSLSEPLYFHAWAHVKDLGSEAFSEMYPHDSVYAHKGLSIDLYRLKRMPRCEAACFINEENKRYLERRKSKGLIAEDDYESRLSMLEHSEAFLNTADKGLDDEVYVFDGPYECRICEISDVLPRRRFEFEGIEFWGPADAHRILTKIYGDYMTPPPINKRLSHYSSIQYFTKQSSTRVVC